MKPLISVIAFQKRIKNIIIKLILLIIAITGLTHYSENPSGMIILASICVFVIAFLFDDEIRVFNNHFEINQQFLFGLLRVKEKFNITNIIMIYIDGDDSTLQKYVNEVLIERYHHKTKNCLVLKYKDETKKNIETTINITNLRKAVNCIQKQIEIHEHQL